MCLVKCVLGVVNSDDFLLQDSARKIALFEGAGLCFCCVDGNSPFDHLPFIF